MPDYRRRLESELVEQIVVVEDQVPDVVERLVSVLVAGSDSRMLGGVDGEALGEFLEQLAFDRPVTAVQVNQRRAAAENPDLGMYLVAHYADGFFFHGISFFFRSHLKSLLSKSEVSGSARRRMHAVRYHLCARPAQRLRPP